MDILNINGHTIETNKRHISVNNMSVVFGDGSTYDMRSGAFTNNGPGYVKVDGEVLQGNSGENRNASADEHEVRTRTFMATRLALVLTSVDVTVTRYNEPGIRVELTGPSRLLDGVVLRQMADTLEVREKLSMQSSGSVVVSRGSIMVSSFRSGSFSSSTVFGNPVTIKVYAPAGTAIAIDTMAGDVSIKDINGELDVKIKGSADVEAGSVSGALRVKITGSGDVDVDNGTVDSLEISVTGSGDVCYGGTAQNAKLRLTGSGDIKVEHAVNILEKKKTGSGSIKVRRTG